MTVGVDEDPAGQSGADSKGSNHTESECSSDAEGDPRDRSQQVRTHPRRGAHNSLHRWYRIRNPVRVAIQYLVILVCRVSPSLRLKRFLLRRIGVDVGAGVAWGLESTPDVFWPNLITVEDHAIIGYDATILCHEFLTDEYRTGEVIIGEGAMIGAGAVVLPGVKVGAGAQVAANSLVAEDVPPGATVAGVPATRLDADGSPDGNTEEERPDGNTRD